MSKLIVITEARKRLLVVDNGTVEKVEELFSIESAEELKEGALPKHLNIDTLGVLESLGVESKVNVKDTTDELLHRLAIALAAQENVEGLTPEEIKELLGMSDEVLEKLRTECVEIGKCEHEHGCDCECCNYEDGKSDLCDELAEEFGLDTTQIEISKHELLPDDLHGKLEITDKKTKRPYQRKRDIGEFVVLPDSSIKYGYMLLRKNHPTVEQIMETGRTTINVMVNGDKLNIVACDLLDYRINGLTALFKLHGEAVRNTPLELKYNKKANTLDLITRPDVTADSNESREQCEE